MHIQKRFEFKELGNLNPGELFCATVAGTRSIGFCMQQFSDLDRTRIALLSCPALSEDDCIFLDIESHQVVMSYGESWLIDPIETAETHPGGGGQFIDRSGVITADRLGYTIRLRTEPRRLPSGHLRFNLDDKRTTSTEPSPVAAIFLDWDIWLDAEDRNRYGAVPFFQRRTKR